MSSKSNNFLYGLLVLMACSSVFCAQGQTQLEKEMVKSQQLSAEVQALTDSCNRLSQLVQLKRGELESIQDVLATNQQTINEARSGIQQEKLDAMREQVSSMEKDLQEKLKVNRQLVTCRDNLKSQIVAAEGELGDMGEFQAIKTRKEIEQKYEQNKFLLTKRYSQLSDDNLNAIIKSVNEFNGLKGFDEYKKRVDAVKKNRDLYNKGLLILSSIYVEKDIQEVYFKVKDLLENKKSLQFISDEQNDELLFIRKYLSRYAGGVKALKGIIKAVNNDKGVISFRKANDYSKKRNCWEAINKAIESYVYTNDDGKKYNLQEIKDRYFAHIPYLNNVFEQYLDQLRKSPLQTTEVEKEILLIKVK